MKKFLPVGVLVALGMTQAMFAGPLTPSSLKQQVEGLKESIRAHEEMKKEMLVNPKVFGPEWVASMDDTLRVEREAVERLQAKITEIQAVPEFQEEVSVMVEEPATSRLQERVASLENALALKEKQLLDPKFKDMQQGIKREIEDLRQKLARLQGSKGSAVTAEMQSRLQDRVASLENALALKEKQLLDPKFKGMQRGIKREIEDLRQKLNRLR